MGRYIPDEIIKEIQERADIHDLISGYVQLKRTGKRWKGLCPFHKEKTPSFVVNTDMQTFHCFGCGKGGNVFTFVMERENVDFPEAAHILADRYNIFIPESNKSPADSGKTDLRVRLYELHSLMAGLYSKNLFSDSGKKGLEYLKNRNFSEDIIKKFNLGFAPDSWDYAIRQAKIYKYTVDELKESGLVVDREENKTVYDRFRKRIIFPIYNERGKTVGFSGRTIDEESRGAKYVNSPETPIFKKSRILYSLHIARKSFQETKSAILCEGQIDVIAMHRAGFTNAIAPQGTSFTEEQAKLLKRYTNAVYLCFDGDNAGIKAAVKAIEIMLPLNFEIKVITLPPGEDPDSIFNRDGSQKIAEYVDNAKDFFEFIFDYYTESEGTLTPYKKSRIVNIIIDFLLKIENSVLQSSYITILSQKLSLPETSVESEIRKNYRKKNKRSSVPAKAKVNEKESGSEFPPIVRAEEELLELAIQHGDIGRRLEEELPEELISKTPVGNALNIAISLTINGEWEFISEEIRTVINENPDRTLSRILTSPTDYAENFDYEKAVSDCIKRIKRYHIECKISELMRKLEKTLSEDKRKLLQEITALQKEKLSLKL
ncbi:MAG: DNA primase [Victivallales bacterium]|nr:DNA primase [Victivallales bacterium]MCF7888918.1 DNA primase [Victivallales bacterium]